MGYESIVVALVLAGFAFFIYKKVKASKDKSKSPGGSGGVTLPKQHEKAALKAKANPKAAPKEAVDEKAAPKRRGRPRKSVK